MTICRKCGKEIPDNEELCEDCKSQASNSGESYLDELMKSVGIPESDPGVPELAGESVMAEELSVEEPLAAEPLIEEEPAEESLAAEPPIEEFPVEEEIAMDEELSMEELSVTEELPAGEPPVAEELPAGEPRMAEEPPVEEPLMEKPEVQEMPDFVLDDMLMAEEEEPVTEEVPDLVLNDASVEEMPEEKSSEEEPSEELPEEPAEEQGLTASVEEELSELDLMLDDILAGSEEGEPAEEEAGSEEPMETTDSMEEELPEPDLGDIPAEEEPEEAEEELPELDLGDIPAEEEPEPAEPVAEEEMDLSAADISDEPMPEDINDLLDLLSKDYSEEEMDEAGDEDIIPEEDDMSAEPVVQDMSSPEISLFSDDDEGDDIFADRAEDIGASVEDIFQDALSAVDDVDEDDNEEDSFEDVFALEGDFGQEGDGQPSEEAEDSTAPNTVPLAEPVKKKDKKPGLLKRIFGNVVTDQTAEEEAREREQEKENEAERAAAKEEKAKQAAADKEAKEAAAQEEKEKKAALKAEQAAAKAAAKEEKKKKKAELAAVEVVGKINPVGATIVMVFFGLICVAVIFGTQSLSYTSALNNAEKEFEARHYERAYESLAGVDVSESSQELADKIRICMQLQKELNSYSNYYEMKMYLESLDSLMKGIRNYDTNKNKADEYEILNQYDELKAKITSTLFSEFGVSETEARTTNGMASQEEYTAKLEEIIRRWEAKNAQDER